MDPVELAHRFEYHGPTPGKVAKHEAVRGILGHVAAELNGWLPEGRDKSLVMTHLENAMYCANAAIARNPDQPTTATGL